MSFKIPPRWKRELARRSRSNGGAGAVVAAARTSGVRNRLFLSLWLFIILVSVIDGYLVLQHRHYLVELNPQGRFLIALNGGKVWLLLAAKFAGTVLACTVLLLIHEHHAR